MRNTMITVLVSLGLAGCASHRQARTLPPPPDFEATARTTVPAAVGDTAASTGRTQPIAPQDQVLFALDSSQLAPTAAPVLDDVVAWVKANPHRSIVIKGQADPSGSTDHNFELSSRRAAAVADFLYTRGVPREQVAIIAVGESDAVLQPPDANRRVVIYGVTPGPATASR
ncbi:MAG TPA: OmpA family protein [Kofleriaceae bacterium]|nr:OmpA family protein [Kofleriaceae bacterium]